MANKRNRRTPKGGALHRKFDDCRYSSVSHTLDLDDVACAAAKALGVPIVISTDAHRPDGLDMMPLGVQQARRGGLTKQDVANTRTWAQLKKLLEK
jgi:histidinol phosphatase-like PHP family hydrolase